MMSDGANSESASGMTFPRIAWGIIGVCCVVSCLLASQIQIAQHSAFGILNNAKAIAEGNNSAYNHLRHIGYPALLSVFAFLECNTGLSGLTFLSGQLLAAFFYCLSIFAAYWLLMQFVERRFAVLGALLLATNPFWFHMGTAVTEDLPGACLVLVGFSYYLRHRDEPSHGGFAVACLFLGLATLFRNNLGPPVMVVVGIDQLATFWRLRKDSGMNWQFLGTRMAIAVSVPLAVVLVTPCVVYPLLGRSPAAVAPFRFVADVRQTLDIALHQARVDRSYWLNCDFLWAAFGWQLCAAAVGLAWIAVKRSTYAVFLTLWLVLLFVYQTWFITVYEVRYLLALFGVVVALAATGMECLLNRIRQPVAQRVIIGLIVLVCVSRWVLEAVRHCDPIYLVAYEKTVSLTAAKLAGNHRVFWAGPLYSIHPRDSTFCREDPYTYVYDFYAHVVSFYIGRAAHVLKGLWDLDDGDVVICNPEKHSYETRSLPVRLEPLILFRVERHDFRGDGELRCSALPAAGVCLQRDVKPGEEGGVCVAGYGFRDHAACSVLLRGPGDTDVQVLEPVVTKGGKFELQIPAASPPARQAATPGVVVSVVCLVPEASFPIPE